MREKVKRVLLKSGAVLISLFNIQQLIIRNLISDKIAITIRFKKMTGRNVELEKPVKYTDKLQWLKLNWYSDFVVRCCDKYEVRKIVAEKIGTQYLNEIYAVYDSVEEIDFANLPKSFVLKATHGSGSNIICKSKSLMDWREELRKMRWWLNRDYSLTNREWCYKGINPRVICERYLEESEEYGIADYKIFCFNGQPKLIQIDTDRFHKHVKNYYDTDLNFLDVRNDCENDPGIPIPQPKMIGEILRLSRILSEGFPHVRVDFYVVEGKVYFGELTFFHQSGYRAFEPEEFEIQMGQWLRLPLRESDEV